MTGSAPLYLLDGTLLVFRALTGAPDVFHDQRGRSVNGVRGYLGYLLKTLLDREVRFAAVAFDFSLTTCWRNELYPAYKANRPEADANVQFQLDSCLAATRALGVPALADARYEADDFIATLAHQSRQPVVIISRDKDLKQLLDERVTLLDPATGSQTSAQQFREEHGFPPSLFADFQALTGDSVDNVPGVRGVGPVTAGKLVRALGTLEAIYSDESRWPSAGVKADSKVARSLLDGREQAFLYRSILRLDRAAELPFSMDATRLERPDRDAVAAAFGAAELGQGLGSGIDTALERYCV